ncbi:MAG: M15 family metallopeptidase [Rickettsiales bacterium]|jgi:D-alanyl-D-alanine dipeptidase|nr:M15 family metallopeptidase [Rickettsiales bacterium]
MIKLLIFLAIVIASFVMQKDKSPTLATMPAHEQKEELEDPLETHLQLVKIDSPYFILDLSYAKDDNFLKHAFYHKFGISACYVHRDLMPMMIRLEQELYERNLRALVFDCFRPQEVQEYMWKFKPDPRFVANPAKGSLHSKGLALDIGLADSKGQKLEMATAVDQFVPSSSHSYECKPEEAARCENRTLLKEIMERSGFRAIKHEWWHYQLPGDTSSYPVIRVCDTVKCER